MVKVEENTSLLETDEPTLPQARYLDDDASPEQHDSEQQANKGTQGKNDMAQGSAEADQSTRKRKAKFQATKKWLGNKWQRNKQGNRRRRKQIRMYAVSRCGRGLGPLDQFLYKQDKQVRQDSDASSMCVRVNLCVRATSVRACVRVHACVPSS